MIEITDFTKTYNDGKTAVSHLSLVCTKGSVTALTGENGAGKSTVIKSICSIIYPTEGCIRVSGYDTRTDGSTVKKLVGYIPESQTLPLKKTVFHYVYESAYIHGMRGEELSCACEKVKKDFELEDVWLKQIKKLSKGFRERVLFAGALVYEPDVLVLDEPASGLDPLQIKKFRDKITELKKDHAIIFSTHIMSEAQSLCDRICIMKDGKAVAQGRVSEVLAMSGTDNLEDAFIKLSGKQ